MSRAFGRAALWALTSLLLIAATGRFSSQAFAAAKSGERPPGTTVTNTEPEFTLTLPDRYLPLKPTGNAICTFGTKDRTAGALVGIYRLEHTIKDGATDTSLPDFPDIRRISAKWNRFPVDVIAWHTTAKDGSTLAARSVQIPLEHQAVSINVLIPIANESLADGLLQDFLTGLDGPSNWKYQEPLTPTERAIRFELGLGLLFVLVAGLPLVLRSWLRRRVRRVESKAATAPWLRNLTAELATPSPTKPSYWIRVLAVVFAIIGVSLGYMALLAVGFALIFDQTVEGSIKAVLLVLQVVCLVPLLIVSGYVLYSRRGRGRVLLDFGPDRLRQLFLVVGILCLSVGIMGGVQAVMNSNLRNLHGLLPAAMQISLAAMFLVRGIGRTQITTKGFWQNSSLLPWSQIGSCRWVDDATLLAVRSQGPVSITLPVPAEHKQAVQDLLTEHGLSPATA